MLTFLTIVTVGYIVLFLLGIVYKKYELVTISIIGALVVMIFGWGFYGNCAQNGEPTASKITPKEIIMTSKDIIVRFDTQNGEKEIKSDKHVFYLKAQEKKIDIVQKVYKNIYGNVAGIEYEIVEKE